MTEFGRWFLEETYKEAAKDVTAKVTAEVTRKDKEGFRNKMMKAFEKCLKDGHSAEQAASYIGLPLRDVQRLEKKLMQSV